jgi:hypothetical protein
MANIARVDQSTTRYVWPVVGTAIVLTLALSGMIRHNFNAKYVPLEAVEFIKKENVTGNMSNNDDSATTSFIRHGQSIRFLSMAGLTCTEPLA